MLKFSKGNAKLAKSTLIFSLSAGHSCPGAKDCKASVIEVDGKRRIVDGEEATFRCYAATAEAVYSAVYESRKHNFELMRGTRGVDDKVKLIMDSMAAVGLKGIDTVRVHESGDYFTYSYFEAWMKVAAAFPNLKFYSYTKSLPFLLKGAEKGIVPENFVFTASFGGRFDDSIAKHGLKNVTVVTDEAGIAAAEAEGRSFDKDDSHALVKGENFALLIHGTQPKGTAVAKYWDKLMKAKKSGYNVKNRKAVRASAAAKRMAA